MIVIYRNKRLSGKNLYIHESFRPMMDIFCALLDKYNLTCVVTSSWRKDLIVPGAIVKPAEKGNHLVGHALDCNFMDGAGVWWNSNGLAPGTKDMANADGDLLKFITELISKGWRWGKAFNKPDDVHFDDGLNIRKPDEWNGIYIELHPEYKEAA